MQMSRVWNNDVALDNRAYRRSKEVVLLSALENPSRGRPVISWSGEFSSPRRLTFGAIMSELRRQLLLFCRAGTTRRSDLGIRERPQMTEGREAFFNLRVYLWEIGSFIRSSFAFFRVFRGQLHCSDWRSPYSIRFPLPQPRGLPVQQSPRDRVSESATRSIAKK